MRRRDEDEPQQRKRRAPVTWRPQPFTRRRLEDYARAKGESRSAVIERAVRKLLDEER